MQPEAWPPRGAVGSEQRGLAIRSCDFTAEAETPPLQVKFFPSRFLYLLNAVNNAHFATSQICVEDQMRM